MKFVKKILAFMLCAVILATSIFNEGVLSLLPAFEASAMAEHEQAYNDARIELDFNKGWSFFSGDDSAAHMKAFDDSSWEKVDLPHDFSISQSFTTEGTEAESGYLPAGTGWYRKWFNLYEYYTGDCITIDFDGVYQHAYVYVNGQYVGENHYGYNSFSFEISEYLLCSNTALNLIAVKVVSDIPSSRWYPGAGISRDVRLTVKGPVHVSLYGPQVITPDVENGKGNIEADITMHNDSSIAKKVTVEATILDYDHKPLSETVVSDTVTISANSENSVVLTPTIDSPELWSPENPKLYMLQTVIKNEDGELIDEYHTTFGYRYIDWDAAKGFSINGDYIKLKGVCLHHDQGALGAVQEYDAIYRQLSVLKEMGCNAIRTSHNTASRTVIDICNELGIFVMEEFFDGWDASKNYNNHDFSEYFYEDIPLTNTAIGARGQKWFEFVVEQTILRDRHDPCVIAWDAGNELGNITAGESTENYAAIAQSIVDIVKRLDPSRVVLQGNNSPNRESTALVDGYMDVIGGNYSPAWWVAVMNDPNDFRYGKPFVATEAASALSSRGVYTTMSTTDDYQCTSYDTEAVSWGNNAADAWYSVVTNDLFSGEFIWTGFDYIGEPTPWDGMVYESPGLVPNSSYFGVVDTAGFPKDSYYLYRSWWNEDSTTLHLVPGSWNEEKLLLNNGYVNVAVYSNAKKIELLLNGKVIATAVSDIVTTPAGYSYRIWTESITDYTNCSVGSFYTGNGEDLYPQFSVKYASGTLSVKAYDENNNEITDTVGSSRSVSGDATQIFVKTWQNKDTFVADGADYIYVEFEARDADGNFMNDYNGTINVQVDDTSSRYAEIVGVDNGNPATTEKFQQPSVLLSESQAEISMFNGKALVILKTTEEEGTINITAVASDNGTSFSTQGITVTSESESGAVLTDEFEELVKQSGHKYVPSLYDKYEMVKHHINSLVPPSESGSSGESGDSGDSEGADEYEIYLPSTASAGQYIPDGDYVIFNREFVLSNASLGGWAVTADNSLENKVAADGAVYTYQTFETDSANVYTFIHQGNNVYYIKNKDNGTYLNISKNYGRLSDTPQAFNVQVNADGSVNIYTDNIFLVHYEDGNYYYGAQTDTVTASAHEDFRMWLYSPKEHPAEDGETGGVTDLNKCIVHLADANVSEGCIPNGDYVIYNRDWLLSSDILWDYIIYGDNNIQSKVDALTDASYPYKSFCTDDSNVFTFTHQGNNEYYIQNKSTGLYVKMGEYNVVFDTAPQAITVTANSNGSVLLHLADYYLVHYVTDNGIDYFYSEYVQWIHNVAESQFSVMWLYTPDYSSGDSGDSGDSGNSGSVSPEKKALYDILHEGTRFDYSAYAKANFEALISALENGVAVYNNPSSTDDDFAQATAIVRSAINALDLDVKKINGTLFKYGYNNTTGTADYSGGGALINDISVRQMKTAILADENLVNQIKDIISYNDADFGWTGNRAEEVFNEVVEIYARIYTLMFTGKPINGVNVYDGPSNYNPVSSTTKIPLTLWNVWTKDNTHGAQDPYDWQNLPIHDGASVQGLAGATLENGVVVSHAAYSRGLSYANDGPDSMYDIGKYTYSFDTGSGWKDITLEYLSGISVYFPDLFTRESLDADGNVTESTTGRFSKYYWDTQFPMFISTDEYGVNTYHYDSKDTRYLVQTSFDDAGHKAEMNLNEVGGWLAAGPNNGSGFFPFNYKQGTTSYTGENAVYHYGFTFEHNFYIPVGGKHVNGEDVIFSFSGDDDVYVYIDGVLVLDNGGLHGARAATINFTECSVNYQYAMDVADGQLKGGEYETTYSYNAYIENPDSTGYNADTVAAINKLHEVITDGEVHTLNFFYLERGSSDSNCKISFNLSETSEEVRIIDQVLTLDYGLPVEYNITQNNDISQAAVDNGVKIEYLGLCAVNEAVDETYTFEKPEILIPFEKGVTYDVDGMKYGICTIDKDGNVYYKPESMDMTESDHFYVCAKITGDPTYAEEVVYYQIEKTTFVPATAIYYEDTFETVTYTNGKVPSDYDNSLNQYGIWQSKGTKLTTLKQTADLTDSEANPYGYEENYSSFATYSGGSVHYTDVSNKNNPNSRFSGGSGALWPKVEFSFTGTGFDLISITDSTTGAFSVAVKDADTGKIVKNTVVDTFYGYNYGRIYCDENGNPTLDDKNIPMYRSENGTSTADIRYYDENGAITSEPHYYDDNDNIIEAKTDKPAYAYAYGWVVAKDGTTDTLYQIPVIKITDLEYGKYNVTVTPTFTNVFGHSSVASDGTEYYSVYLDAIKIYSPAGDGDDIADREVKDAYSTDDELYPSYLEIKDMLIGAESLGENSKQGIIFIDGIAALDNDLPKYKKAGPNNELYLAKDQAVAFEIWATAVPTDIQLGTKLACGNPKLTVSYGSKTTDLRIKTATDIYYSLNTLLPNDAKLTWQQITGSDGNNYYTTGTIVIQNTGEEDSVLSVTNMKWTFSQYGSKGFYRIPTPVEDEQLLLTATVDTQATAYSLMRMRTAALDIEQTEEPEVVTDKQGNTVATIRLRTSADVESIVVADENGIPLDSRNVSYTASEAEDGSSVEWTVTITTDKTGTHIYMIAGAYANGYTDISKAVEVTLTVEKPSDEPSESEPDNEPDSPDGDDSDVSIVDVLLSFFEKIIRFIKTVFASLGIELNAI